MANLADILSDALERQPDRPILRYAGEGTHLRRARGGKVIASPRYSERPACARVIALP